MPTPTEKIQELVARKRAEWDAQAKGVCQQLGDSYEDFVAEGNEYYAYLYAEGVRIAEDRANRDDIETIAEFFGIDFELLRKLPIRDFDILSESYFVEEDHEKVKTTFPLPPEWEQGLVDYEARFLKAKDLPGGLTQFFQEEALRRARRKEQAAPNPLLPKNKLR